MSEAARLPSTESVTFSVSERGRAEGEVELGVYGSNELISNKAKAGRENRARSKKDWYGSDLFLLCAMIVMSS